MATDDWYHETYPWIPDRDTNGHKLGPGLSTQSMVACKPCPATTDGRGHHVTFCGVIGCHAAEVRPPGCTGAYGPTRAERYADET